MTKKNSPTFGFFRVIPLLPLIFLLTACGPRYEYKAVPLRDLADYPNQAQAFGATIAAEAFYDSATLTQLFGFDLKKAGVVPLQLQIENSGNLPVEVGVEAKILDDQGRWWEVLPAEVVYQRIDDYTNNGMTTKEGAKRTVLAGVAGGLVGAAVGVATGSNVGEAAGKGAAIGAAAGAASAILGIGPQNSDNGNAARDFSKREVGERYVEPGDEAHGFFYFPGETSKPIKLRLSLSGGTDLAKSQRLDLDL